MRYLAFGLVGVSVVYSVFGALPVGYTDSDIETVSGDTCISSLDNRDWNNIRIHVHHMNRYYIDPQLRATANRIRKEAIPEVLKFWEKSMKVRRVSGPLRFERDCMIDGTQCSAMTPSACSAESTGDFEIPYDLLSGFSQVSNHQKLISAPDGRGVSADLVLLIDISDHPGCIGPGRKNSDELASAYLCRSDSCGRPILGVVNICVAAFDASSPRSFGDMRTTISHELTHVFGLSTDSIPHMRYFNGAPRVPPSQSKTVLYHCGINRRTGQLAVRWDVDSGAHVPAGSSLYTHTFAPGILASTDPSCRCPTDPSVRYSSADIAHCLANPCGLTVVTPTVAAMAKWFFDCPAVAGAALENQPGGCEIVDPHWKTSLFKGDYMGPVEDENVEYFSPITWAFLDDTGWYRMDYLQTSGLVVGAFWGFKQGCDFATKSCLPNRPSLPVAVVSTNFALVEASVTSMESPPHVPPPSSYTQNNVFCTQRLAQPVCSANALYKAQCSVAPGLTVPSAFQYITQGPSPLLEYCPVMSNIDEHGCAGASSSGDDLTGKNSRCLNVEDINGPRAVCMRIKCISRSSYSITTALSSGAVCNAVGARIAARDGQEIVCADPAIICHDFAMPHPSMSVGLPNSFSSGSQAEAAAVALAVVDSVVPLRATASVKSAPFEAPSPTTTLVVIALAICLL